jgi:flavin-dependent dehydrogenase
VDLYFFEGGYCGVQPIAASGINVCALVRAEVARNLQQVFARNRSLWRRSRAWEALTETVSTSPVFFREPKPLRAGVVCAGDAAGFLDPFAGDGISLALHSGALAAGSLAPYLEGRAALTDAAQAYAGEYRRAFLPAFRNAARLRRLFSLPRPARAPVLAALRSRRIGGWMVAATRARVQPR